VDDRSGFWQRVRTSRLFGIAVVYLGTSWIIVQVVNELGEALQFPPWASPVAVVLLAVGFLVVLATAWVQSHPLIERREAANEVPGSWSVAPIDLARSVGSGRFPHLTWGRAIMGGLVTFGLLVAGGLIERTIGEREVEARIVPESPDAAPAIAVLPFGIVGADTMWRDGMVHLLSTNLDGAGGLRAIDHRSVLAAWRAADPGEDDLGAALAIARSLRARHAVIGSVVDNGGDLVLAAQIYDADSGATVGRGRASGPPDDVVSLIDRLAIEVLRQVLPRRTAAAAIDLERVTTGSLDALRAFLEGEALFREGQFAAAATAYEQATAADSSFALAWWRLGQARGWTGAVGTEQATEPIEKALALSASLPARQARYVKAAHGIQTRSTEMLDSLRVAVGRYPDDAEAWYYLGEMQYHLAATGLWDSGDAESAFEMATRLDPEFAPYWRHRVDIAFSHHADSGLVAPVVERYEELAPNTLAARSYRLAFALAFGDSSARAAPLDSATAGDFELTWQVLGQLGHPRLWPSREQVLLRLLDDGPANYRGQLLHLLAEGNIVERGRLDEALQYVAAPDVHPFSRTCMLLTWHNTVGAAHLPEEVLDRYMSVEALSALPENPLAVGPAFVCAAIYAESRGRTAEAELLMGRHRRTVAQLDTLNPSGTLAWRVEETLVVSRLERRGEVEAALSRSIEIQQEIQNAGDLVPWEFRLWTGRLLLEVDRPREAIPYFLNLSRQPFARYQLGRAYEAIGQLEQARDSYSFFLQWWADASPEFQPLVEDAREALIRIQRETG
jgi:tetratricopeptide (TPR) repeat protein